SNNRSRLSTGSFGTVPAGGSGAFLGLGEHSSRAPSVRSLAESGHHLAEPRAMEMYNGHSTLLGHHAGGFDDIDLPSAVKYLIASDPNLQVLGAAYLQHKCYSDSSAKKQARSLQAMPKLVKLFNSPNQEVQRHATGAMRNLIYDNAENKLALVEENGIYELMRTLREPDDELRKNVTGILWNLSSSDNLKDRLARDTLEQLTDLVLVPLSGLGGSGVIQQNPSEAEIFYNSTGFLRNLSSASQQTRQKMRECHGLVDSMIHYVNSSLEVGKSEDKSVENAVCVLRNLSYRLYDEMPPSSLQRLEGHRRNAGGTVTGELVGCFSPQSKKAREHYLNADIVTFTEVSKDPKGMEWLWNPQIVGIYNRLLQRCELNKHTTEAASGALQNITAGDRRWAGVLSRLALEQERILNPVLDRVRTADHHQLRSLTGLIRNLSRHARNKDEMSTKVVSHLIEKLPGSVGDKAPPADVIVNIIAVLNNLVVESPMAARDIVYFDGLRKLFFIKKRRDRWELPCPSPHPGSCPALLSLPAPVQWSQVSLPKPWCWESPDWLGVALWPPGSPLSPDKHTPPLSQLPFPIREPLSALACCGGIQPFTSCPLSTCTNPPVPLGPSGVVSLGWWALARAQWSPKPHCILFLSQLRQ
uniref:Plakophilin 3 n=1 Tax=Cyanistes caeruleus TaxID=156563 RepID=A0A8C0V505_CYACU